jgi:hypothetical protein
MELTELAMIKIELASVALSRVITEHSYLTKYRKRSIHAVFQAFLPEKPHGYCAYAFQLNVNYANKALLAAHPDIFSMP